MLMGMGAMKEVGNKRKMHTHYRKHDLPHLDFIVYGVMSFIVRAKVIYKRGRL
jgi:hypothetical protein